jgi:hypothetical protein
MASEARDYLLSRRRRVARHLRAHGSRALVGGVTAAGVLAGFLSASDITWPLWAYLVTALLAAGLILGWLGRPPYVTRLAPAASGTTGTGPPLPPSGALTSGTPGRPRVRIDDAVYEAGLRVLLPPSRPLIVISSNRRDVGKEHELPLPLFSDRGRRTRVDVDLRPFGIPLAPYAFERELPEGTGDVDHTMAVKDLVFVPELAAALGGPGEPAMLPEHCVDPELLSRRDVVVIGGPDTNFWHGALFEPVAAEFATPRGPVPLAFDLRDLTQGTAVYGSRSMSVQLTNFGAVFPHTREDRADLDERLYPTYGMALAVRNPFAAACGRSHWCVFVAGTRSLGTSGAVLGLTRMLRAMRDDADRTFFSYVPTRRPGLSAPVSAVLFRTSEVERSVLRRGGRLVPRERHHLPPEGGDPDYSDSYVPTVVEYLHYDDENPRWVALPG